MGYFENRYEKNFIITTVDYVFKFKMCIAPCLDVT